MPVITLITDWGIRDHYLAGFKGELFSLLPEVRIFDITHEVEPFDTLQASFVLKNCFKKFPEETIHFIGLSASKEKSQGYLLVKANNHFFMGYDNGIFYLTLGETEKEIFRLDIDVRTPVPLASRKLMELMAELVNGKPYDSLGVPVNDLVKIFHMQPAVAQSNIRGTIIYIDRYENLVLNITKDLFEQVGKNRAFTIDMNNSDYAFNHINAHYDESVEGEPVILFNENGNMEVALNRGKAAGLLGVKLFDTVRIEFHDAR